MPRKRPPRPSEHPQTTETWGVLTPQLRLWITPKDAPPNRPFLVLVLNLTDGALLGQKMFPQAPTAEDVESVLAKAMIQPAPGAGKPRRPRQVVLAETALAEALAPALARVAIAWTVRPLPEIEAVVRQLEAHLRGGQPERPSLLSVPGVTPEFAGALFAAAADYYRAAPWVPLNNGQTFALQIPTGSAKTWIASVMGNGGVEYGLGLYHSWAAFEKLFMGVADNLSELLGGHVALLYGGPEILPFDDFDAMLRYGWALAAPEAHPAPMVMAAPPNLKRPTLDELRQLEAALRVIPRLAQEHLKPAGPGEYQPFEVTLPVATHAGEVLVRAVYPGGQLTYAKHPVHSEDDRFAEDDENIADTPPLFDRRMMEGQLAQMGAQLGAETAITDPQLREAQALMYQAWEADNPAKRLALAHQALATSADCADAYVLLAEEEADSLARAADYYQQGVTAGERALGTAYFAENKGHFWGLLETRPYVRARQGLADTLWHLKQHEAARAHYHALLALNPDDNQGVRHTLLNLLLEMDRWTEARALLQQYDDGLAEWLYTWALVEFQQSGASPAATRRLRAALKHNRHVVTYLSGHKRIPTHLPPYYGFGDEAEAMHYAHRYLGHWRRTSGAVAWLQSQPLPRSTKRSA